MTNPPLNAAQLSLLQTFAHIKSEEGFEELRTVLLDFYVKKLDESTDKWWQDNDMTVEKFEEKCNNFHLITADPDDNKFVDCALNAGADFIVTNDRHFNVLKNIDFPKINVIDIDTFKSIISG